MSEKISINEFVSSPFPKYKGEPKFTDGSVFFITVFQMDKVSEYFQYGNWKNNPEQAKQFRAYYEWKYKDRGGIKMNSRTWGCVSSLEEADYILCTDMGSIHECSYTYAVVEEIPFGVIAMYERQWFYKWNEKKRSYQRLKTCPKNVQKYLKGIYPQFADIG
jgi:hypothetical protein